jgi:hypothetical protein
MSDPQSPEEWAFYLNQVFDEAFGAERHPISVIEMATMFTERKFPQDPISRIEGGNIPGVEGILAPDPKGKRGWAIFFDLNTSVRSKRRIRFTLAHEFGHYLLHRYKHPNGFECKVTDIPLHDRQLSRLEDEADRFAANFLMPIQDFQRQISPSEFTDLNMLGCASDRYGVSLTAAVRQWLRYTEQRAVLAVSDLDGFILWSEASVSAKKAGAYFPKVKWEGVEVPAESLAANRGITNYPKDGVPMPKGTWFKDHEVLEMGIHSDQYGIVITLLMLDFERDPVGGWE